MPRKKTYLEVKEYIENPEFGSYILLSSEYINNKEKLNVV